MNSRGAITTTTALACALVCVALGACGGSPSSSSPAVAPGASVASGAAAAPSVTTPAPAAQRPIGEIERTKFDPELHINLDSMSRRPSGLYVQDVVTGTGAVATRGKTIVVRYTGSFPDGRQFDAGEISVALGGAKTIAAWEEGLLGMRVGGKRRLVVPPNLGYGTRGAGDIPPNAVLVFTMEVTSIPIR